MGKSRAPSMAFTLFSLWLPPEEKAESLPSCYSGLKKDDSGARYVTEIQKKRAKDHKGGFMLDCLQPLFSRQRAVNSVGLC